MRATRLVLVCGSISLLGVAACTTRAAVPGHDTGVGGGDDAFALGDDTGGGAHDASADLDACGAPPDPSRVHCTSIYAITGQSPPVLYRFDPTCLRFEMIGTVSCTSGPLGATPFSMAVARDGTAWVLYTNGHIFNVDVRTAACTPTSYVPNQSGFLTFGMGFSTDAPGGDAETLFVSRDSMPYALARIDTTTLTLTSIGIYDALGSRAELTGTGDARLFGAFEGTPFVVAEIDKSSASILSQAPQSVGMTSSNFAFAAYAGAFFLFVGPGAYTDVYRYDPSTGASDMVVSHFPQEIVGAGVSTCAPVVF